MILISSFTFNLLLHFLPCNLILEKNKTLLFLSKRTATTQNDLPNVLYSLHKNSELFKFYKGIDMKISYILLTVALLFLILVIAAFNGNTIAFELLYILKILFAVTFFVLGKLFFWLWPIILIVLILAVIAFSQSKK